MFRSVRNELLRLGSSAVAIFAAVGAASAQQAGQPSPTVVPPGATQIPQITVTAPKRAPARPRPTPVMRRTPAAPAPAPTPEQVQAEANRQVVQQTQRLDQKRDDVLQPKVGTNVSTVNPENVPQGSNIAISDLVYQFPGVSQDSTSSGDFHVRNDHANVQFRINGIQMPDGVSGFSQFFDSSLFSKFSLITGALPAQYGLHTTGILDITTKSGQALSGGSVSVYGGSYGTITPSFEYGGVVGNTEYFVTGRFSSTNLGLENPTGSINADHDHSDLARFFSYTSSLIDPDTRFVTFAGVSIQSYQIPTNPGQQINVGGFAGANGTPAGGPYSAFGVQNGSSSNINQNQYEKNTFFVAAVQRSVGDVDMQLSYYNRYSELHFVPDPVGDLLFNNIDTDVFRSTFVNGLQGDFAYRLNDAHTLRAGFITQGEQTRVRTLSTVEPLDQFGNAIDQPTNVSDGSNLFGWQVGTYVQDEWKLLPTLTLNTGLRFDQMWQYVDKNQVSPRGSLQWQPWWATVAHIGYARNFTPPDQALGRVTQPQLLGVTSQFPFGTTATVPVANVGPILPERSDVYDVGIVQQLLPRCPGAASDMPTKAPSPATNCPALEVGVDAYYKWARDLIDDGQFGQAYLLSAFNYDKGMVKGIEFKAKYTQGNFTLYTNWATGFEKAINPVSNQAFFDPSTLAYLQNNWIYTDHTQLLTGSAGASYLFADTSNPWLDGTKISTTMIYGSGLRADGAPVIAPDGNVIATPNGGHVPAYTQVNLGLSHEFKDTGWDPKPFTVRFDVVNLFDTSYIIRNGTGIGVFAPQYGPRRGYFVGFTQQL
jgi:outer membrane receptor protein involved in Fe transport